MIAAHNFAFDFMFMRAEFEREGERFTYKNSLCSMKKFTPVCKIAGRFRGYKHPKLSELCAFMGITERDISEQAQRLFGACGAYHDARFDAAAVYLAVNRGLPSEPALGAFANYI